MSGHRHPNSWGSQRGLLESSLDDEGTLRNPCRFFFQRSVKQSVAASVESFLAATSRTRWSLKPYSLEVTIFHEHSNCSPIIVAYVSMKRIALGATRASLWRSLSASVPPLRSHSKVSRTTVLPESSWRDSCYYLIHGGHGTSPRRYWDASWTDPVRWPMLHRMMLPARQFQSSRNIWRKFLVNQRTTDRTIGAHQNTASLVFSTH